MIPFPKTQKGTDLMTDAPTRVVSEQLTELHVRVVEPAPAAAPTPASPGTPAT